MLCREWQPRFDRLASFGIPAKRVHPVYSDFGEVPMLCALKHDRKRGEVAI